MIRLLVGWGLLGPTEQATTWPAEPLQAIKNAVGRVASAGVQVGFYAADLASGETIWQYRGDQTLVPASNAKLAVTAAALELLGPEFQFQTRLFAAGDGLLVVGGGDPATGDPRICEARGEPITAIFERWAAALRAKGLTRLDGDLLIDDSIFESEWVHPNWSGPQYAAWYRAPVGGLNFNDNCVEVVVVPAAKAGAATSYELIPPAPHIAVVNRSLTGKANNPVVWRAPEEDRLLISGQCSRRSILESVAVVDPGLLFGWACKSELAKNGVAVAGTVKRQQARAADGSLSGQVELVAVEQTALPDLIYRCNKRSQNLFAECLLKMIGLRVKGDGSWQAGCQAVGEFLAGIGLPAQSYRLDDGSGLSRQNRFSARALTQVLIWARRHPHGQLLVDSLPVWGVDGSLRGRLNDPALRGRVRAKTGSLAGVSALSGYAEAPDGRVVVFSMLFNDVGKHGSLVQTAEREVAQALVSLTREPIAASGANP